MVMRVLAANKLEYAVGGNDLLLGVEFSLYLGDRVALVGRNGSGKTSLLRILNGELEASRGTINLAPGVQTALLAQEPQYPAGSTLRQVLERGFARLEAMEQELLGLEARLSDPETYSRWDQLHQRFEAAGGYTRAARYRSVLKGLAFEGREDHQASELSGGEARRLALGEVLLSGADILLLDEPTNHLDLGMRDWLAGFITNFGGALMLVSHDRGFLDRVVKKVAWLRRGKLLWYQGNYSSFRGQREKQEAQELKNYQAWQKEKERLEAALAEFRRWAASSEKMAARKDAMESRVERFLLEAPPVPVHAEGVVRMRFPADAGPERVLEGVGLEKSLSGRRLFRVESLVVRRGERVAIIGPNGAGKTTLLKVLLGLLPSDDPKGHLRTGTNVRVGYYDQKLSGFDPDTTLYQTLYRILGEKAHAALGAWQFPYLAQFKKISALSGGERARLSLLALSLEEANLLVLDEPTNHLDLEATERLEEALSEYPGTLLLVSHDLYFLNRLATRTWHITDGVFTDYPGTPRAYLERQQSRAAPSLPPRTPSRIPGVKPKEKPKGRWRLEREREALEQEIASLESGLGALRQMVGEAGLGPEEYTRLAGEMEGLEAQLAEKYQRWETLAQELEL